MPKPVHSRAVTLLELLVVLTIITILASISYPTYLRLKLETKRSDAQAMLIAMHSTIKNYLLTINKPSLDAADLTTLALPTISKNGAYSISVNIASSGVLLASSAWFGDPNNSSNRFEVSAAVNSLLGSATSVAATTANFGNPASGVVKTLSITFTSGSTLTCKENDSITAPTASSYTIIATASGTQAQDTNCNVLIINSNGEKSSKNSANATSTGCW